MNGYATWNQLCAYFFLALGDFLHNLLKKRCKEQIVKYCLNQSKWLCRLDAIVTAYLAIKVFMKMIFLLIVTS